MQAQIDSGNMTLDMVTLGTAAVEGYKDRVTACCAFYETFRDYMQYQGEETVNGFDCKRYDAVFETAAGKQSVSLWIEKDYGLCVLVDYRLEPEIGASSGKMIECTGFDTENLTLPDYR